MAIMGNELYSALAEGIKSDIVITDSYHDHRFSAVETTFGMGICMYIPECSSEYFAGVNSYYNHGTAYYEPYENYYTKGIDFHNKTVGVVGHMAGVKAHHGNEAKKIYIFDYEPKDDEDLSPELEDELLPDCDIVVASGSSLINGTLPHLLELCQKSYFILTGPSVPQCPVLLDFGIDRLAGFCITDIPKMRSYIKNEVHANFYQYGTPFIISK